MKRALSGVVIAASWIAPAIAADLPVKARVAPVPVVQPWNWTGCYIGVEGGGNWGHTDNHDTTPPFVGIPVTDRFNLSGGLAGGTVGCNYEISKWVIGIENDFSWTNKNGVANEIPPFGTANTIGVRERWIDTLRGRLGFAFGAQDQLLVYVTGGGAFARTEATTTVPGVFSTSVTGTMTGWTVGGGLEWAFFPAVPVGRNWWSVKAEYLYVDLGSKDFNFDPSLTTSKNISVINNIFRVGVNWHFF